MINKIKGGFTLVEIIVVLVILAVLTAIAIPSYIGYINKSKVKTAMLDFRACKTAIQTVLAENHKKNDSYFIKNLDNQTYPGRTPLSKEVFELKEIPGGSISSIVIRQNKLSELTYSTKDHVRIRLYSDGKISIEDGTPIEPPGGSGED
ncbi:MAG: prepilin-type N-terminal cleavage/methylation domain-containing protein [Anaerovoracaceae bacterium]